MYTASAKKRENIAEYILYMWQIEDLIRANNLDIDRIDENIISKYTDLSESQRKELRDWYESLIDMMRREDVVKSGHLQINRNTMADLEDFHRRLLADPRFADYANQYYATLPLIVELRSKAGDNKKDELETCFNALYMLLMMRLQGKQISPETLAATQQISKFLALLSHYYRLNQQKDIFAREEE